MFSPPNTRHASASAVLPTEPQYWKENLPAGFARSGYITTPMVSNDARLD